jgi:hypothetical protein
VRFDLAVEPAQDLARVGELVRRAGGAGTSADLVRLDLAGAVFRVAGTDPDLAEKVSSALRAEGIPLGRAAPSSLPGTS